MRVATSVVLLSCVLFAVTLVTPAAGADHCTTKIVVFGRSGLAPVPATPYSKETGSVCPRAAFDSPLAHVLPPNTDQILVRINGEFGPSITSVRVELTGLGFESSSFLLNRTANELGGFTFSMRSWVFAPDPGALDGITATAYYPEAQMKVHYRSTAPFVPAPPVQITPSVG